MQKPEKRGETHSRRRERVFKGLRQVELAAVMMENHFMTIFNGFIYTVCSTLMQLISS